MSSAQGCNTQLALRGPQDILTMSPKGGSFFHAEYPRHTNFASGEAEQACNNTPALGRSNIQTEISRAGDLLSQIYVYTSWDRIQYTVPANVNIATGVYQSWVNGLGFAMIDEIDCIVGQMQFGRQDGHYMYCREQQAAQSDRLLGEEVGLYDNMGQAAIASMIPRVHHTPLQFWFNNWLEQALPSIGLYWNALRLDLSLKTAAELTFTGPGGVPAGGVTVPTNFNELHYLCNFHYLDRPERAMFANQKLEQIIEQVQFLGEESYLSTDIMKQVNIRWNHPVTDIFWTFQKDSAIAAHDWFDFSGVEFAPLFVAGPPPILPGGVLNAAPYQTAQVFLNNNARTLVLPVEYFSNIPAHRGHNRIPHGKFIGSYPLGVEVDSMLHSGSINFSRMDTAYIRFGLWPSTAPAWSLNPSTGMAQPLNHNGRVRVYARSFNLSKMSLGMMGVKFAA